MSDDRELKALERVTREAREEPSADLDWERVEARLFERIESNERQAPPRASGWRIVAALAAAAVIALFVGKLMQRAPDTTAKLPDRPVTAERVFGESGNVNGAELHVGDSIVADGHSVVVDHPGVARWTLETSGRAVVADTGEYLTIKLESGSISARVVPSARMETFAVEVDGARVAVHGTAFRVQRASLGLRVEVSEGVVAVGPVGQRGHTEGWLLRRGDSGDFRSDGTSGNVVRAETAAAEPSPLSPPSEPAPKVANAAPRPNKVASPAEVPADSELRKGIDGIESSVRSCYAQSASASATDDNSEVRVRFTTELTVVIGPDGKVRDTSFEPPLAPAASDCVKNAAKTVKFPESQKGATTTRSLLLGS